MIKSSIYFISLWAHLIIFTVTAQYSAFNYARQVPTGTNIFVLTNRTIDQTKPHSYTNMVKNGPELFHLLGTWQNDSLYFKQINEDTFINRCLTKKGPWVVFIHGDSKTIETAAWRGLDLQHLYGVNVLVFSWPSKLLKYYGTKNFNNSNKNVYKGTDHFISLLKLIKKLRNKLPSETHLTLMAHSLGNLYLKSFIENDHMNQEFEQLFDRIIMNAAAVDQKNHAQWMEKLDLQKELYVTVNRRDFNLKGARIFTRHGKQLGEKLTFPLATNAKYIQFNQSIGFRFPTGTTHTYFVGEVPDIMPYVFNFYHRIFYGKNIELHDTILFEKRKDSIGYELLPTTKN